MRSFDVRILVNGQSMEVADGLTLLGLLAELGIRREYTAVAVNREVTPRHTHGSTVLHEADRVEIVHPMTGGA